MIYFDTAYLLKLFLNEPDAHLVRQLAQSAGCVASCTHGRVEFWSGVQRHVREGRLSATDAHQVFVELTNEELGGGVVWLPLDAAVLRQSCAILENHAACSPLRAGDAIHLAAAQVHGFNEVHTSDRHMLRAATLAGLQAVNILP